MAETLKECPVLNLTNEQIAKFTYHSFDEMSVFLIDFGYTEPDKRYLDAFYTSPDLKTGIGVLNVTELRVKGHFGVMRGVELAEFVAQCYLALNKQAGKIELGKPFLTGINDFSFPHLNTAGAILNGVVELSSENQFGGYGWVLRGKTIVAQGEIKGAIGTEKLLEVAKVRAGILQARTTPLFPFRG